MPRARKDLTGCTFGRWQVGHIQEVRLKGTYWQCLCACGTRASVRGTALLAGATTSCGCYRKDTASERSSTHGQSKTSLYAIWWGMKSRCTKPTDPAYSRYGGRGLKLSPSWHNFEAFAADVGPRPEGLQLERKKNHLGYSKGNCVWATAKENNRNKRSNVWVRFEGRRMTVSEAAERSGIRRATLYARLKRGVPTDRLFEKVK